MTMDASTSAVPPVEATAESFDVEAVLRDLEDCLGRFPEAALRQCQQHRDAVIPHLIRAIERATELVRAGERPTTDTHWIGAYLLWEFAAHEALPAILEGLSLPGEGSDDLFGDAITEDFSGLLLTLAGDRLEFIEAMIDNDQLNEYVRSAAMGIYQLMVRDGVITRAEGVERLRKYLRTAIDRKQDQGTAWLICELDHLNPHEAMADIREAYELGLVDTEVITLANVEESLELGDDGVNQSLSYLGPTKLVDTVEHLRGYYHFQERDVDDPDADLDLSPEFVAKWNAARREVLESYVDDGELDRPYANSTIRNEGPRIGRNDPCPCGSGKKYKKCCLRGDQSADISSLF